MNRLITLLLSLCLFATSEETSQAGVLEIFHLSKRAPPLYSNVNGKTFSPMPLKEGDSSGIRFVKVGANEVMLQSADKSVSYSRAVQLSSGQFQQLILIDRYDDEIKTWRTEMVALNSSSPTDKLDETSNLAFLNCSRKNQQISLKGKSYRIAGNQSKKTKVPVEEELEVQFRGKPIQDVLIEKGDKGYLLILDEFLIEGERAFRIEWISSPQVTIPKGLRSDLTFGPRRDSIRRH